MYTSLLGISQRLIYYSTELCLFNLIFSISLESSLVRSLVTSFVSSADALVLHDLQLIGSRFARRPILGIDFEAFVQKSLPAQPLLLTSDKVLSSVSSTVITVYGDEGTLRDATEEQMKRTVKQNLKLHRLIASFVRV